MALKDHPGSGLQTLSIAARDTRILELKLAGATLDEIANQFDMKPQNVKQVIKREIGKAKRVPAEMLREIDAQRYERLLFTFFPLAEGGDLRASEHVLKIMKEMRDLLGYGAPAPKAQVDSPQPMAFTQNILALSEDILARLPKPIDGTPMEELDGKESDSS